MSEKPNLEQMLKLWSKKDLWNRIQEKNKQISGLEAKLEAREEAIKYLKGIKRYDIGEMLTENTKLKQQLAELEVKNDKLGTELCNADNIVSYLQQQLAEKEKEIENIKLCKCVNCTNEYEFMLEGLVEDLEKQIDRDEQEKISFAVEQLKYILNIIESIFEKALKQSSINQSFYDEILNCIELKLKALEEGKNIAVTKEQKKSKQSLLVNKIKDFKNQISQPDANASQEMYVDFLNEIEVIAKQQAEVLRLAALVTLYKLSDEKDSYFKSLLSKQLYKIYVI